METTTPASLNILERFNRWIQESIMVKLFSIGFLILILLIPSSWIENMIVERQQRAEQVMSEVADKWSGSQLISGYCARLIGVSMRFPVAVSRM